MATTEEPVKNCPILQTLVQVGDDIDNVRNAVLECVCEYHGIQESERYINSEAVIRYVYNPWEKVDDCEVELYARKEYEEDRNPNKCLITPKCVVYSQAYKLTTPVNVIHEYLKKHYRIDDNIYYRLFKKC